MVRKSFLLLVGCFLLVFALPVAAQDDELVFGVVLVGPANDRGWSQSHAEGAAYVEANLPGSRALIFESLNPADTPETTLLDVVTEMVNEGASIVFTASDSFEEDTDVVAEVFPDVVFINITGSNVLNTPVPPNVGNFYAQMEIPRLFSGCVAALTTETGGIGYLGALINAETRRLAVATYLGAEYCYEKYRSELAAEKPLDFTVTWIGFWFNIPGVTLDPTEVVNTFFNSGADVVISGIDTSEAIQVAGQRNAEGEHAFAIPYGNVNGCSEAPDACLGVAYYNWGFKYLDTINQVIDGTWEQAWEWLPPNFDDIANPEVSIISYENGPGVTEENAALLQEFYDEVAAFTIDEANADKFYLWDGPLNLQDGTELAAEGEYVDLLDIWFLPQLVEGMTGASVSE